MATDTNTINLDGELDTTPDETYAQALDRILERDDNLCEMVGYMGDNGSRGMLKSIRVQTMEARCELLYNAEGKLVKALVNGRTTWEAK